MADTIVTSAATDKRPILTLKPNGKESETAPSQATRLEQRRAQLVAQAEAIHAEIGRLNAAIRAAKRREAHHAS
jgi:hypothetical protein